MSRFLLALPLFVSACAGNGGGSSPEAAPSQNGGGPRSVAPPGNDIIRLRTGEVYEGRIVEHSPDRLALDTNGHRWNFSPREVYAVAYAHDEKRVPMAPLAPAGPVPAASAPAPSSWYPRETPNEHMVQREHLFHETHLWTDCLGQEITKAIEAAPEFILFAPPGGRIVFHDPKLWGYHAHLLPSNEFRKPVEKAGLRIEIPKEPTVSTDAVVFVSPAQEVKPAGDEARLSYAVPDAIYALLRPLDQADALLASQPFAGGKPVASKLGAIWAFSMPRNSRQCWVYLIDREGKHSETLKNSFVSYRETLLAADCMVDVETPAGLTVARVLLVPVPEGLSADGPAPEPFTIFSGSTQDPLFLATVQVPPREALLLPPKPPSTKTDVVVTRYEVSREIPERSLVTYGTGKPTGDVTVKVRDLAPDATDDLVKVDLSSLPEERFPAVAWFMDRRSYIWKTTGGYLPPAAALRVPPRKETVLARIQRNEGIPHAVPILFRGPNPLAAQDNTGALIAGGMATGLLRDALAREAGGVSNVVSPIAQGGSSNGGAGEPSIANNTYVNITVPPHVVSATGGSSYAGGGSSYAPSAPVTSGTFRSPSAGSAAPVYTNPTSPNSPPTGLFLDSPNAANVRTPTWLQNSAYGNHNTYNQGTYYNAQTGAVMYSPTSGSAYGNGYGSSNVGYTDPFTGASVQMRRP